MSEMLSRQMLFYVYLLLFHNNIMMKQYVLLRKYHCVYFIIKECKTQPLLTFNKNINST